jgi:hypothetical protein
MIHCIAILFTFFSKEFAKNGFRNLESLADVIALGNPCNLTISLKNKLATLDASLVFMQGIK